MYLRRVLPLWSWSPPLGPVWVVTRISHVRLPGPVWVVTRIPHVRLPTCSLLVVGPDVSVSHRVSGSCRPTQDGVGYHYTRRTPTPVLGGRLFVARVTGLVVRRPEGMDETREQLVEGTGPLDHPHSPHDAGSPRTPRAGRSSVQSRLADEPV